MRIPPDKVTEFNNLKSEFDALQKALDPLATRINATTPFPKELFDEMREMQRRSIAIQYEMMALCKESEE